MAESPLFAAPDAASHSSTGGGVAEIFVALVLILALIAGLAWFTRRMRNGLAGGATNRIQVLATQSLGVKERAVLVRVGDTDILVGVAQGAVHTLHVFPAGANTEAPPPVMPVPGTPNIPNFKDLLLKALGK